MANELQIMSTGEPKRFHVFDKREGQTVGALVARDFTSAEDAVAWCCANYGVKADGFSPRANQEG